MPGWLRSEQVAGFERNQWLQSSECAMLPQNSTGQAFGDPKFSNGMLGAGTAAKGA
jgi:hypothetical protein